MVATPEAEQGRREEEEGFKVRAFPTDQEQEAEDVCL
jgi:hypothetical protein